MKNLIGGFMNFPNLVAKKEVVSPPVADAEAAPVEVFVDPACSVCDGDGIVSGNRCVLCDAQGEIVQSLE